MGRQLRYQGMFQRCAVFKNKRRVHVHRRRNEQDWNRLASILAPELEIDYSQVTGSKWDAMTSGDFVTMISSPALLGNPLVKTQHFIGASRYEIVTDSTAVGNHQIRAAHQRYGQSGGKSVEAKGHGHGVMRHRYVKIAGSWKLAGVKPMVYWNEFDFEKIFAIP